jgi:hypothetical protein
MFPADLQRRSAESLSYILLSHVREAIRHKLNAEAEERDGLDDDEIPSIISEVVRDRLAKIRKYDRLSGFGREVSASIRKEFSPVIGEMKKELFGKLELTQAASRGLTNVVLEMLQRDYFGPLQTGVVFAGFGERDYMPKLVSYSLEEMVDDKLRIKKTGSHVISDDNAAAIIPFAQQEMVHAFLQGIDPSMGNYVRASTDSLFEGLSRSILGLVGKSNPKLAESVWAAIEPEMPKILESLFKAWEAKSREHWRPIVQITSALPKDELASMAEALVNLTKFRRRVSAERETVGGPIDVAVITKGDGFVWVKRKHYFRGELNPRVIARYQKG